MQALQNQSFLSSDSTAMDQLHDFLSRRRHAAEPSEDFDQIEQELHRLFVAAEREALGHELSRFDLDVPRVEIDGERYDQVLRCETTYNSAVGPIRVERSLYRHPSGGYALCPLEFNAGMIEGYWTPLAAKQASWAVAHLTPKESEELFDMLGNMTPSKSSLDRLPKALSTHWEVHRVPFEVSLRQDESVPPEAVSIGVSLDGVMVPMKDGDRQGKREQAKAKGKSPSGPAGYQEVGCGTVSYYDRDGERLLTRRMSRMPESHKATLKDQLTAEIMSALIERPDLRVVKLADGATDNWTYLSDTLPFGDECLDFYHASEHLSDALAAAYGQDTPRYHERFETLCGVLRDDSEGVNKIIAALSRLRTRYPRREAIHKAVAYFREHRHRMPYARLRAQHLPIGSGVVEAACKTLVSQRLKRSGMRWREAGGQAILTFRALCQSDRFDRAWSLLSATYKRPVGLPRKVIALNGRRERV
ncbi:MAG TPA: hypothetical protein VI542_35895 [Candidatus Tectomicrobia bacterium]